MNKTRSLIIDMIMMTVWVCVTVVCVAITIKVISTYIF